MESWLSGVLQMKAGVLPFKNSVLLEDWICVFHQADLRQTSERQFIYIKIAGKGPLILKYESAFMFHF